MSSEKIASLVIFIQFIVFGSLILINFNRVKRDPIILLILYSISLIINTLICGLIIILIKYFNLGLHISTDLLIKSKENLECSICLDYIVKGNEIYDLNCNHKFHKKCLEESFFNGNKECPLCRANIKISDII